MKVTIQVPMAKENPQSWPVVAIWVPRGAQCVVAVAQRARARRTRTGSHIDGDHTAPTRSQTQKKFSAAPCADGEGQGSAQGAWRRPKCKLIELVDRSINSPESL